MVNHLSLRLAWHNDGWNGHICKVPKENVYCIGAHSYPGDMIAESRDLQWESSDGVAGCHCSKVDGIPPCAYSINAFGAEPIKAKADPPDFFRDSTETLTFNLPAATACVWPYEVMYSDDVVNPKGSRQTYNYDKRLENAKEFFAKLSKKKSLVFYYANKSNPFSEDDAQAFVLVGISRLLNYSDILYYQNVSEENRSKYADGFIWQMPVTSTYPDEGFRIPYQKYLDNDEVLSNILFIPEHAENFKYAAKHISDDDALIYIERLVQIVDYLIKIGDDTEEWEIRKRWLQTVLAELWQNRGPYPGVSSLFAHLGFGELIEFYYLESLQGNSKPTKDAIFKFLNNRTENGIPGCRIDNQTLDTYRKSWLVKLKPQARTLAESVLTRIALSKKQIENVLKENRDENGITSPLAEIITNPYRLCEEYIGDEPGDEVTFTKIDHAMLPSPELGLGPLVSKDDWRRLRALMVDELQKVTVHSFVSQDTLLSNINQRLSHYPDWKRETFNEQYIDYDKANFEGALEFRANSDKAYVYLKQVYSDERAIEGEVRELLGRTDIKPKKPYKDTQWHNELYQQESPLAKKAVEQYELAIQSQMEICKAIFNKPLSVIAGSAGTGKTTIIRAVINAIKHTSGNSENFCLLAPTGKAADRIREKTGESAMTIHRFLTGAGWMNPNFSMKVSGGREVSDYSTYIIDESSMIDLTLMATLFRSINWHVVSRLILVGDPNQLPPIGKGKVFSEIIQFIKDFNEDAYGKLTINVRQMENMATGKGTGIIDLASLYIKDNIKYEKDVDRKTDVEFLLKEIQEGEETVRDDLRIVTWKDSDQLEQRLTELVKHDMEKDKDAGEKKDIMNYQVISPYRGELFGTENLNAALQTHFNGYNINRKGNLGGVSFFDKVIQYVNRSGKKAYYSYNMSTRQKDRVEVFNGELGRVRIPPYDLEKYKKWPNFRLRSFNIVFERKGDHFINFDSDNDVESNVELAYAISVHKAQGSEFDRVYFVLPKSKQMLLSTELLYTGITRAAKHLTILVEQDYHTFITMRRPEKSRLALINSSVFSFKPLNEELFNMRSWYEEGKIHSTLSEFMVRSKSEVIIANMLAGTDGIPDFSYEEPLIAQDATFYLPDFTIKWRGKTYYWEHLGLMNQEKYKKHWKEKERWYNKHFPGQLVTTQEGSDLSIEARKIIQTIKSSS